MADKKNEYDYVNSAQFTVDVERTQINKFHTKGGTGFAAEEANAMADRMRGATVEHTGGDNALNGADRITNGVPIQTKYFDNAPRTVGSAFDQTGTYRYGDQQLEVPKDQYDACVELMREMIRQGRVPGYTEASDAEKIVRKGEVTYRQARNIAKAGNIDSLVYDAKTQAVTTGYAFAISFSITFAKCKWDKQPTKEAVKQSIKYGLLAGATSFITGVVTSQLLRTKAAAAAVPYVRTGVKAIAKTDWGKAVIHVIAQGSTGKPLTGAAAQNHVAKLLRTNTVAAVVTTVVLSTPDFYRAAISKNVSWAQASKNLVVNAAGVAAGTGGWWAGAAGGTALGSVVPGLGSGVGFVVGGMLGAFAGGAAGTAATKYLMDGLIVDDAKEMVELLPELLQPLATDYLLSSAEVDEFTKGVSAKLTPPFLRDMYKISDRAKFVYDAFEPACEVLIAKREHVEVPDAADVQEALSELEEEALAREDEPPMEAAA